METKINSQLKSDTQQSKQAAGQRSSLIETDKLIRSDRKSFRGMKMLICADNK